MRYIFITMLLVAFGTGRALAQTDADSFIDSNARNEAAKTLRQIYDTALTNGHVYDNLRYLCKRIGPRLSGSPQAAAAVEYTRRLMEDYGFDTVWLQPVMVPRWVRGEREFAKVLNSESRGSYEVPITALGGSVATPEGGITAELIEVRTFDELKALGREKVEGKIVFFSRPFDPAEVNSFAAYGGAVNQRYSGAMRAAELGAVGSIVRSMCHRIDTFPHTGTMGYDPDIPKIPHAAISTFEAERLSKLLKHEKGIKFHFELSCRTLPDVLSYNVIGEIYGTQKPDEIIAVGGHLDSWDLGEGAHDDGAGCMQSIEALRLLQTIGYRPKRTLRAVMFMNEENGLRGATAYADSALSKDENHVAALESDRGGLSPRGFSFEPENEKARLRFMELAELFRPYYLPYRRVGGSGADIGKLSGHGLTLIGLVVDSQRYFNYHHTDNDVFENVNRRELELGAAAMAGLLYLLCEFDLQ